MIFPVMAGKEPDVETAKKTLHEKLPRLFDCLEGQIGGREYLVGGAFSIAGIAVAAELANLRLERGRADAGRRPPLAAFAATIHSRPGFADCIAEEQKLFPPHGVEL